MTNTLEEKNWDNSSNRRNFLRQMAVGACVGMAPLNLMATEEEASRKKNKIQINPGDVIVFQGDSITDANRKREITDANNLEALGYGYTYISTLKLLCDHAEKNLVIYNRGISGNKVTDLLDRWEKDCLLLKPNVLSILIGVNDFWSTLKGGTNTPDAFLRKYEELLDRTRQRIPDCKIILGEPFAIKGVMFVDDKWYPQFKEYQQAVHEVSSKYKTVLISYQSHFDKAQKKASGSYWAVDGVHPSLAGHQLMSQCWLSKFK